MFPLWFRLDTNLFLGYVKWKGYFASAVNEVSSNPSVGSSPRISVSLFLLSICTGKIILASKIMTFFLMLPSVNENFERESNSIL